MAVKLNRASRTKTWRSGQNRVRVPVTFFATRRTWRRPPRRVKLAPGLGSPLSVNSPVTPRRKLVAQVRPSRSTSMSSREARALTTEAPTPCRPPEAV
jgi:hypothetical protein